MLFNVKVVSPQEYDDHLRDLQQRGNVGLVMGGSDVGEVSGLDVQQNEQSQTGDTVENGAAE